MGKWPTQKTNKKHPKMRTADGAQFWNNQPDPLLIERGQADAIRLVRNSINPTPGTTTNGGPTEANATNTSRIPQMVFLDDEGLEEQFLTDEETANALDTSANCVTTPVNTTPTTPTARRQDLDRERPSTRPSLESQHISAKYTRYLKAVHWGSWLQ